MGVGRMETLVGSPSNLARRQLVRAHLSVGLCVCVCVYTRAPDPLVCLCVLGSRYQAQALRKSAFPEDSGLPSLGFPFNPVHCPWGTGSRHLEGAGSTVPALGSHPPQD